MKEKIVMIITIGIICVLLASVMFLQFKSVKVIEESGISDMQESELREEYTEISEKIEELSALLEETEASIEEYNNQSTDSQGTIELLQEDVNQAKVDLGYTDVKGSGIVITIEDGDSGTTDDQIQYYDLLLAINELKYAGAEAISINDQRVVNTTFCAGISDKYIIVNDIRQTSPYVIKAIGDTKYLESIINIKGGLKDQLEAYGKKISYTVEDEVYINKYTDTLEITYGE